MCNMCLCYSVFFFFFFMEFQKERPERNAAIAGLTFQFEKKKMELSCFTYRTLFPFYLLNLTNLNGFELVHMRWKKKLEKKIIEKMSIFSISIMTLASDFKDYLCCPMYEYWKKETNKIALRDTLPSCEACLELGDTAGTGWCAQ